MNQRRDHFHFELGSSVLILYILFCTCFSQHSLLFPTVFWNKNSVQSESTPTLKCAHFNVFHSFGNQELLFMDTGDKKQEKQKNRLQVHSAQTVCNKRGNSCPFHIINVHLGPLFFVCVWTRDILGHPHTHRPDSLACIMMCLYSRIRYVT